MTPRRSIIGAAIRKLVNSSDYGLYPDPYWNNVVLGLHMDGSNNGTTFTDVKGKTVTPNGNVQTKTATKKFGTASAYFDGTDDYLSVPDSADWDVLGGDFTVEAWVYRTAASGSIQMIIGHQFDGIALYVKTNNTLAFAKDNVVEVLATTTTVPLNTWVHVAVFRLSGVTKLAINGAIDATASDTNSYSSTSSLIIGAGSPTQSFLTGYIDDLRITKGVARYSGNYTVDTAPFANR